MHIFHKKSCSNIEISTFRFIYFFIAYFTLSSSINCLGEIFLIPADNNIVNNIITKYPKVANITVYGIDILNPSQPRLIQNTFAVISLFKITDNVIPIADKIPILNTFLLIMYPVVKP